MTYQPSVAEIRARKVVEFFKYAFKAVVMEGPPLDFQQLQHDPLMIVCTHRSHVDYFMAGSMLYKMGIKNMRFAAGDNLTGLPWIGPMFQKLGAFTVERDTGFERFYVRNLCEQVITMLQKKEAVIVFPEGGRSYSGANLELKSGVLGSAVLLQARNMEHDVRLLPMAISYDCTPDVPFFKMLLLGKKLRKRNNSAPKRLLGNALYFGADLMAFVPFVFARKTKRQYGTAYIDYMQPLSVKDLVSLDELKIPGARDDFSAHRNAMNVISADMHRRFIALYRILPLHLLSSVLIRNKPLTYHQAATALQPIFEKARSSRNCKSIESFTEREIVEEGVRQLLKLKAVSVTHGLIEMKKQSIVEYFAAALE